MSTSARSSTSTARPPAVVGLILVGIIVAAGGVATGVIIAAQETTTCADSDVYRLVNLFCQHVHHTHPHVVVGTVIAALALILGAVTVRVGMSLPRRRR